MAKLEWHKDGERLFESGLDRGVLYPRQTTGVAWNGLISVDEKTSGGEIEPLYYDGVKYYDFVSAEDFEAELTAFSAPAEFSGCDGTKMLSPGLYASQQPRYPFGLSYRTGLGNDLLGTSYGYKLHLVYNATASPTGSNYSSAEKNSSVNQKTWGLTTVPPAASTYKPTAHFVIDSTKTAPAKLEALEALLYGTSSQPAMLPEQSVVISTLS